MYELRQEATAASVADQCDAAVIAITEACGIQAPSHAKLLRTADVPSRDFLVGHAVASGFGGGVDEISQALDDLGVAFTFHDVVRELGSSVAARYAVLRLVAAGVFDIPASGVLNQATAIRRRNRRSVHVGPPSVRARPDKHGPYECGR